MELNFNMNSRTFCLYKDIDSIGPRFSQGGSKDTIVVKEGEILNEMVLEMCMNLATRTDCLGDLLLSGHRIRPYKLLKGVMNLLIFY